jgi:ATP-dependent DNA ligase
MKVLPLAMERWTISYRISPVGTVEKQERYYRRSDGAMCVRLLALIDNGAGETLTRRLEQLIEPPGFTGRAPGGPSRWSTERSGQWKPLRPELVVEVRYDKVQGNRFRHGSRFIRFRDDKDPDQCTWREVRPPRRKDDPTFESLLAS